MAQRSKPIDRPLRFYERNFPTVRTIITPADRTSSLNFRHHQSFDVSVIAKPLHPISNDLVNLTVRCIDETGNLSKIIQLVNGFPTE